MYSDQIGHDLKTGRNRRKKTLNFHVTPMVFFNNCTSVTDNNVSYFRSHAVASDFKKYIISFVVLNKEKKWVNSKRI